MRSVVCLAGNTGKHYFLGFVMSPIFRLFLNAAVCHFWPEICFCSFNFFLKAVFKILAVSDPVKCRLALVARHQLILSPPLPLSHLGTWDLVRPIVPAAPKRAIHMCPMNGEMFCYYWWLPLLLLATKRRGRGSWHFVEEVRTRVALNL